MTVEITEGQVSAIRLLRTIEARAPQAVKAKFQTMVDEANWPALLKEAAPLIPKFGLKAFTAADISLVGRLNDTQRDVIMFYHSIKTESAAAEAKARADAAGAPPDPTAKPPAVVALKARIDDLLSWGAWESVAKIVAGNPKIPFRFEAVDVRQVFDPYQNREMSDGEAQAKTFLNLVKSDPSLAELDRQVDKFISWGGFSSVAQFVIDRPKIPFRFGGDDVRRIADPEGQTMSRTIDEINVLSFWDVLGEARNTGDTDNREKVGKFYDDLQNRVRHGCWNSIADIVNKLDKCPINPTTAERLRNALDPSWQYGDDNSCEALEPPEPPAWTKPIVWGIGAYGWTMNAVDEVENWSTDVYADSTDWASSAAGDAVDWAGGAYGDASDWTSGALDTVEDWAPTLDNMSEWSQEALDEFAKAAASAAQAADEVAADAKRYADEAARNAASRAEDLARSAAREGERIGGDIVSGARNVLGI